jgi:hypothetical protein
VHFSDNEKGPMYGKTPAKQNPGSYGYQSVLSENMHAIEWQMSCRGAAGKIPPLHIPALFHFSGCQSQKTLKYQYPYSKIFYLAVLLKTEIILPA